MPLQFFGKSRTTHANDKAVPGLSQQPGVPSWTPCNRVKVTCPPVANYDCSLSTVFLFLDEKRKNTVIELSIEPISSEKIFLKISILGF